VDDNAEQVPPIKFEANVLQIVLEESDKMANMTCLALLDEEREENYTLSFAARSELVTTYMSLKATSLLLTDLLTPENLFIEDGVSYVLLEDVEFANIMNAVTLSNQGRVLLKSLYNISLSSH
tara:strand:- start:37 stop:405 length:369 start_codon:yes stop_codon:yes gene_type:complete